MPPVRCLECVTRVVCVRQLAAWSCWLTSYSCSKVRFSNGVGGGVRGMQGHPQEFWFVENAGKIPENQGQNWRPMFVEKPMKTFCWRSHQKKVFMIFAGDNETFSRKSAEIWAKSLRNPPEFACSCTCTFSTETEWFFKSGSYDMNAYKMWPISHPTKRPKPCLSRNFNCLWLQTGPKPMGSTGRLPPEIFKNMFSC